MTGRRRLFPGPSRTRGAFFVLGALCATVLAAGGCRTRQELLRHGHRSPEALAARVVQALAERDLAALRALAVTEDEFRDVVWPSLPASRPARNVPRSYAWETLHSKSEAHLRARLATWEDRGFRVVSVAFQGPTTDHGPFRVRRQSVVTLRDRHGRETAGRLFGSVIEMEGRFKVFSYVVD